MSVIYRNNSTIVFTSISNIEIFDQYNNCPSIKYKILPNQIFICHLSSIIFSASYVRTILLLRVEDAPDSRNFHFHLREEKEKLSSTRRDLLTDSITDSLKLRGIFIVGHECKLPVGSGILAVLIIFKRVGGNLNWKFLLSPSPPYDPLDLSSLE